MRIVSIVILLSAVCLGFACKPADLTRSQAASVIEQETLDGTISTEHLTANNLRGGFGCTWSIDYLTRCKAAGLLDYTARKWSQVGYNNCPGDISVELTEQGEEYFSDLRKESVGGGIIHWTVTLKQPITIELVEVTGITKLNESRRKVEYSWKYVFPPILLGCTPHSEPSTKGGKATFTLYDDGWRL
jgi:hypothetical protein